MKVSQRNSNLDRNRMSKTIPRVATTHRRLIERYEALPGSHATDNRYIDYSRTHRVAKPTFGDAKCVREAQNLGRHATATEVGERCLRRFRSSSTNSSTWSSITAPGSEERTSETFDRPWKHNRPSSRVTDTSSSAWPRIAAALCRGLSAARRGRALCRSPRPRHRPLGR